MDAKTLYLYFPQWQGSGQTDVLWQGAEALKAHLRHLPFQDVAVSGLCPLEIRHDVLGFDAIVRQLDHARQLMEIHQPERVFVLGGDCGVEIAPISWLNRQYEGDLAVLWLDAHGDLNTPASSPSKHFHGMPLRHLLGEGAPEILSRMFSTLASRQVFLLGARAFDGAEQVYIQDNALACCDVEALSKDVSPLLAAIRNSGFRNLYVHLDLDVLDPAEFPAVLCPTPKGLSIGALQETLKTLETEYSIVGCSLLEFTSPTGQGMEITDLLPAWITGR